MTGTATWALGRWVARQFRRSENRPGIIRQTPDLVTPKPAALLEYQLSLRSPTPVRTASNGEAAAHAASMCFRDRPSAATCHQGPNFTDVLSGPGPARAASARSIGSWDGPMIRVQIGNRQVSDDTTSQAAAASTVLSRRQCARPSRRGESLRQAIRSRADAESESRSRPVARESL